MRMRKRRQPPMAPMLPFYDPARGKFSWLPPSRIQTLAQLARQDLDCRPLAGRHLFTPQTLGLEPFVADRVGPRPERGVELSRRPDVAAALPDHRDHVRHDPDERAQ